VTTYFAYAELSSIGHALHEPEQSVTVTYLAKLLFAIGVLLATALFFGVFFIFPLIRTQVKEEGKLRAMTASLSARSETLEQAALTDSLTGMQNRRYFDDALREYLEEFRRISKPVGLMILDLDHFKQVNDTHGHDVGDEVLREFAVRLSLLSAGIWWGGFAVLTFATLRADPGTGRVPVAEAIARAAAETRLTLSELRRLPQTLRFLLAYMTYNDGIQTVIAVSTVFLAQELFVAQGRTVDEAFLIGLVLMIQFVAFFGALLFERIAAAITTKRAIALSLVVWTLIVIYAYGFLQTTSQAWLMGAALAVVLGGSQALSRSLYSRMIPAGREAAFYGLYEISERGTSWIGPLLFGAVAAITGSYRQAILSLIVLFAAGLLILALTNTAHATREAEQQSV